MIYALRNRRDSTDLLAQIEVPTLVIGGDEDEICSPEIMGAMARANPQCAPRNYSRGGASVEFGGAGEF